MQVDVHAQISHHVSIDDFTAKTKFFTASAKFPRGLETKLGFRPF
jgi:hypothetical protein